MKAALITFVILIFSVFHLNGQDFKSRIGIKAQPGITDFLSKIPPHTPRLTFNFGLHFIQQLVDSTFYIETGLYYASRGSLQKDFVSMRTTPQGAFKDTTDIYIHNYHYSLPILFRVNTKNIYIAAGPIFDYYSHSKYKFTIDNSIETWNFRSDNFWENLRFGFSFSIGTELQLSDRIQYFIEGTFASSSITQNPITKEFRFFWNFLLGTGLSFDL